MSKTELPLGTDSEIESMVMQFLDCTLPYQHWTHRAHLSLAIYHLRHHPFDNALEQVRNAIERYNHKCGDPQGYNETITVLYMRKLAAEQGSANSCETMDAELKRLSELCSVEWLYEYYSKALIWSEQAKVQWQEPDIRALDF